MSVLVKGVQMPKNCKECPFLLDDDACYAVNKPNSWFLPLVCNGSTDEYPLNEFPYWEKRVDWCPLIEVNGYADAQKHGKWISGAYIQDTEVKRYSAGLMYCSVCKHEAYSDTDYGEQLFDYCPYCGSRMQV